MHDKPERKGEANAFDVFVRESWIPACRQMSTVSVFS